jgi:hypothetical protein
MMKLIIKHRVNFRLYILNVFITCCTPCLFSIQDDTVRVNDAAIPPVIDGIGDDACWGSADWQTIDQVWINYGENIETSDYNGRYRMVWSSKENQLYFLIETTDDVAIGGFSEGQTADVYNYDISEVFIDEDKSGGPHISDNPSTGENAENAFAYHIYADIPDEGQVTYTHWVGDIPRPYTEHIPGFALRKTGDLYTREFSVKVYNDEYDENDPEASLVKLSKDKIMGLSVAYCDNDEDDGQRDNFFGSVWVSEANNNSHWMNADDFGTVKLYSELTPGSVEKNQPEPNLMIYPNPASDYFNIVIHESAEKLEIIDLAGNTTFVFLLHGPRELRVPVSNLAHGIYFTRIITLDNTITAGKLLIF